MSFEPPTKRMKTSSDDPSVSDHASVQEVTALEAAAKDEGRGAMARQISDASTASSDGEESLAPGPARGSSPLRGRRKRPRESAQQAVDAGSIGVFDWGAWAREPAHVPVMLGLHDFPGVQEAIPECPMEVQQPKTLREILELPLAAF
mmetsp:Transcript_10026/g.23788  ORF Transcript_10026/g.23788 Transcript_10026/m.23788 type:complete len:148 (+) Transcript_10026:57-500(+)